MMLVEDSHRTARCQKAVMSIFGESQTRSIDAGGAQP
jgi:hypothetical protein